MSTDARWNTRLTALNEILAELYPTTSASRRVVKQAELPAGFIKFNEAAIINWFNILELANARGRVDALVAVACAEFPRQERLTRLRRDADRDDAENHVARLPMRLTGPQQERLRTALLSAFASHAGLAEMVTVTLSTNLHEIVGVGGLSEQVFGLIDWAALQGRLDELVNGAQAMAPGNPELKAFAEEFGR